MIEETLENIKIKLKMHTYVRVQRFLSIYCLQ